MSGRIAACVGLTLSVIPGIAVAQSAPVPLYPAAPPPTYEQEALPPVGPAPAEVPPRQHVPASPDAPRMPPPNSAVSDVVAPAAADRIFCNQPVSVRVADPDSVAEGYRAFVGMWSDASWTPQLCAALVVENVAPNGTATIVYAFGPMGPGRGSGGVLHGTGVIQHGELRFQNSDGSQYTFKPLYSDLDGHLTTPQGQNYGAIFKKAL